jgi:hypothetical protein
LARAAAALAALALVLAAAGCGGDEGVAAGATVSVYAGAGLCPAARRVLDRAGGEAGDLEVRLLCVQEGENGARLDLATLGADARRATQDSTAVAYLEAPGEASAFVAPILEEAGVALVRSADGGVAMHRALGAIGEAGGSGSLRDEVRGELEPQASN